MGTASAPAQVKAQNRAWPIRAKKVKKAVGYLEAIPRHQSLATHEYEALSKVLK